MTPQTSPGWLLEHIADFLDYLQIECGLARNTRLAYGRDLKRLARALAGEVRAPADLRPRHIQDFLRSMRDEGLSVASISRALAAARMFSRYLVLQGVIERDVTEAIQPPKSWNRLPTVLGEEVLERLLSGPNPEQDTFAGRDRALLYVLYGAGLRASEAAGLLASDVNERLGVLRVLGKGSKERIVPLAGRALEAIRYYMQQERPGVLRRPDEPVLFLSRTGRPLGREDIFRIVRKYVRRAGLGPRVTPHTLRHCFATQLLSHGADLRSVQEMLGHADIATTQIYTHVDASRIKAIHRKFHPRG